MNNCVPICLITFALIGFFIGSQIVKLNSSIFKEFKNSLNSYQLNVYKSINKERTNIFIFSFLLGIILASAICYHLYYINDINTPNKNLICLFISITLFVTIMGYTIMPKSKYIISYLTDTNQINKWLDIYKSFKTTNYISLLIGILIFYIYSTFNKKII